MKEMLKRNRYRFLPAAAMFLICLFPVRALALPGIATLTKGQYKASELISMGYSGYQLKYSGGYLTLIMDADLSLTRLVPTAGNADAPLTIMGQNGHTLTLDSYDSDFLIGMSSASTYEDIPASVKCGNLSIENTTVRARGLWYTLFAKNDVRLKNATIITDAADVGIDADGGSLYIQDGCQIDCSKSSSNAIISKYMLKIADSHVNAIGSVTGIRSKQGEIVIESGTVNAVGGSEGIQAGTGITISGGTVTAKTTKEGYYEGNGGIVAANGSITIFGGNIKASGSWSGISNRSLDNSDAKMIRILGGTVDATGTHSAISSPNPVEIGASLKILVPAGGSPKKTGWNAQQPYAIADSSGMTGKHVLIGPPSTATSGTVTPEKPASSVIVDDMAVSRSDEKDVKGSSFSLLRLKGTSLSGTSVKLTWKRVPGAKTYVIYGNRCGTKKAYERITEVTGTSWTQKKLKKGTYYKYLVVAADSEKTLAISRSVHVATKGGRYGNFSKVTLSNKKIRLKKGKTKTVKAAKKRGKLPVKEHRALTFESDNTAVATVSSKGRIRAVRKGTCYVYAYVQNGLYARVKVTVK